MPYLIVKQNGDLALQNNCNANCQSNNLAYYDANELINYYETGEVANTFNLSLFGDLSLSDANTLLGAVAFILALAFVLRLIRNFILNK